MLLKGRFPELYPILDAGFLAGVEDRAGFLRQLVRDLTGAGVGILQYRNKTGGEAEILADAKVLRRAVDGANSGPKMLLILNDWPSLAVEAGFDGVHVGQTDLSPGEARAIVGPERVLGVSTHNEGQLRQAEQEPVDYLAIGPIFATASKQNPDPVVGLDGLRQARRLTAKPLVAIGGIKLENAGAVRGAGADSVALISAFFAPGVDAAAQARAFLQALALSR